MEPHEKQPRRERDVVQEQFDAAQADGRYEEGMARMALYHRHCQDPVIFRALGDIRGKALLDLACGDGFYTRRFRGECGAHPVVGVDLSPMQIEKAREIERRDPLGIEYRVGDVRDLDLQGHVDLVTAIHLLHYLEDGAQIEALLQAIHGLLHSDGSFVTMIANPEFDIEKHDAADSKEKFAYYFSAAEPGNGGLFRFHPGGFERERELTVEFRRWERDFIDEIATAVGLDCEWHDPFISEAGIEEYGADFFANYLANPQSKLVCMSKR